ncbi:MAG: type II toxin-antitoxin system VapB family antitoxin [Ruminiclostridium sp.]|nr:type II toxin-antitoxin system VapB family antitoxin [Ruminiclostridium sp.]
MRTNILLDDKLLNEAFKLSSSKTKKDLIHEALEEYVVSHQIKNLMDIKGKIEFDESYNYKAMREGK